MGQTFRSSVSKPTGRTMREIAHSTSRLSTRRTSMLEREDPQPFTIPSKETSLREMPLLHNRRVKVPGVSVIDNSYIRQNQASTPQPLSHILLKCLLLLSVLPVLLFLVQLISCLTNFLFIFK